MRVEVGMKERFKKKLVWSRFTYAGHVERMEDKNGKSRCTESGGEKEASKTRIAMGLTQEMIEFERNIERVEECREKATDRRNCKLL